jgi:hypothetical protein
MNRVTRRHRAGKREPLRNSVTRRHRAGAEGTTEMHGAGAEGTTEMHGAGVNKSQGNYREQHAKYSDSYHDALDTPFGYEVC